MAAAAVAPNRLSMTPFRLGMQAVRTDRPSDIWNQIVLETANHVESEKLSNRGTAFDRLGMVKMGTLQVRISQQIMVSIGVSRGMEEILT